MSRHIDIEPILEWCDNPEVFEPYGVNPVELERKIRQAPSMDIVHCGECMYYADTEDYDCEIHSGAWQAGDFCSYGERSSE